MCSRNIEIRCNDFIAQDHWYGARLVSNYSGFFKHLEKTNKCKGDRSVFVKKIDDVTTITIKPELSNPVYYNADLCIVEITPDFHYIVDKSWQSRSWKELMDLSIPIILYEDEYKRKMKLAEGKKSFRINRFGDVVKSPEEEFIRFLKSSDKLSQTSVNQFAHQIGAVKYVQWNSESVRGAKVLLEEICYAGLGKTEEHKMCVIFIVKILHT